jgi:DNA-cytosine methyltransferase
MKLLSLFDGISCARVALDKAGIPVEKYYASEIDKYAISISQKNYPDIIQIGDVKDISSVDAEIDLLIGGSPCQDLSIAKKNRQGLDGARSGLFWEYVRILNEIKPKYFILENVASMPKEAKQIITEALGVEPIMINAALVSAQNRKRLFWVGKWNGKKYEQVIISQPEDRGILLKDILQPNTEIDERMVKDGKSFAITASYNGAVAWNSIEKKQRTMVRVGQLNSGGQGDRIYSPEGKSVNLSANGGGRGAKTGLYLVNEYNKRVMVEKSGTLGTTMGRTAKQGYQVVDDKNSIIRKLTPVECERLQSLPDNYTEGVSNTQRYKALGNGFNVEVISHILKYL